MSASAVRRQSMTPLTRLSGFELMNVRCVFSALLASILLVACAPPEGDTESNRSFAVGATEAPGSPGAVHWTRFADRLSASQGDRQPRLLTAGQLGSEEQLLAALRRNRIQLASVSSIIGSTVIPELALIYSPYLFADIAEADHVFDHYLADYFARRFEQTDIMLIGWFDVGLHHVYSRTPRFRPEDFRGVRFRISASEASSVFATAIGADRIALGFADIVPALQTGLVEAGENAISSYARSGIAEQARYLTLTGHANGLNIVVANRGWWQSLDEQERYKIREALPSLSESREIVRTAADRDLESALELGIVAHTLSHDEYMLWRQALAEAPLELARRVGGDSEQLLALVREGIAAFRSAGASETQNR